MLALLFVGCGVARSIDDGRRCATPADCETIHPGGIADPASSDFHGAMLASDGWNLGQCARCHGDDFAGGKSGKSCLKCHSEGPTGCTTCHDQPPPTGAHRQHAYACAECHVVPTAWNQPGHLFGGDGKPLARAAVSFGAIARTNGAAPRWDGERCDNTYCHGAAAPRWAGGASEATCGSCHAVPPSTHANNRCGECHGRVADDSAHIIGPALHADGKVNVGDESGTCLSCHPAPGGAHAAHTSARHRITRPLACNDCHRVPATLHDPGHIDQPRAVVFPDGTSALARAGGATPTWNGDALTCSNVWCHGSATPEWNGRPVVCGSCHGVPPATAPHTATMGLADCARCHAKGIDPNGVLLGAHLDGVVDVQ